MTGFRFSSGNSNYKCRTHASPLPLINIQIESNEAGRLLRRDVKVIKDEVVQCAVLIDSLTNQNQLHSEHQV